MAVISVEVSDSIADKFSGNKIIKYEDILDYEDNLKYNFSDEKVSLGEVSSFLGNIISDNKKVC